MPRAGLMFVAGSFALESQKTQIGVQNERRIEPVGHRTANGIGGMAASASSPRMDGMDATGGHAVGARLGSAQAWWAIHGSPPFGRLGFDLMVFTGWRAVGLCAAAAVIALALRMARWSWPLLAVGWAVCATRRAGWRGASMAVRWPRIRDRGFDDGVFAGNCCCQ